MSGAAPDFSKWLRQGRGLAVLTAGEADGTVAREALLDACTHFTGYDFQSEGSRAEYLFDVLVAAGLRDELEAPILDALQVRDGWDREQLLDLALLFAFDGSRAAEDAIQGTFLRRVGELERPGAEQLVRASGLPGLVLAAREFGRVIPDSGADWPEVHALELAETHFGTDAVAQALTTAAAREPGVGRYWDAVRAYRTPQLERTGGGKPPLPFPLTFDGFRAAVVGAERPLARWTLRRWGVEAPAAELAKAAEALGGGLPPVLEDAILRAFAARPFPGRPEVLIRALERRDEETVEAAWRALRRVTSPEVRARAIQELSEPRPGVDALQGLERNFREDDVPLILRLLEVVTDDEELHSVGLTVQSIVEASGGPCLGPVLLALYERGVCGVCRRSLVKSMHELGVVPRSVLEECRRDAFLELRAGAVVWAR